MKGKFTIATGDVISFGGQVMKYNDSPFSSFVLYNAFLGYSELSFWRLLSKILILGRLLEPKQTASAGSHETSFTMEEYQRNKQ